MSRTKTFIISILVLLAAAAIIVLIFLTEPEAKKAGATKETAMLVDVVKADKGTFRPVIVATGTIEPAQDIILSPRVSGEIVSRSENFVPGGFVKKGEILLQIDPSDYKNILALRKSDLNQAEADLAIEMGRQDVARKDYHLFDEELAEENKSLVLRQPQLNSAKARVEAARAAADQAELELRRTTIRAPFDAQVLSREVNIGSQVAPGQNLGSLVGVDQYWVIVSVPVSKLRRFNFPENAQKGSLVKIRNRSAWEAGQYREGRLFKLIGALEGQTRLARLIVEIPDPLARKAGSEEIPILMIGSFVETSIIGEEIKDVIRLNRNHIRKNQTVWINDSGKLKIQEVDILFTDAQYAYIKSGIEEGELVVTTNLSTVVEGSLLRTEEKSSEAGSEKSPEEASK